MEVYLSKIMDVATSLGLEIVEANLVSKDMLELSIARIDYSPVDLDTVSEAAAAFGEALDYSVGLDVSSAGAERVIKPDEYHTLKDQYVLVKFVNPIKNADYVEGVVMDVNEDFMVIQYRQLHASKTIEINLDNISFTRLAVKV